MRKMIQENTRKNLKVINVVCAEKFRQIKRVRAKITLPFNRGAENRFPLLLLVGWLLNGETKIA